MEDHNNDDSELDDQTNFRGRPPPPPGGHELVLSITLPVVLILITVVTVTIILALCCYIYHRRKRRDLANFSKKGGLVILDDDLKRASNEGRLVINVSSLDSTKMSRADNQYVPPSSSIPLTNDGYATLEPEDSSDKKIMRSELQKPEDYIQPLDSTLQSGYDHLTGSEHDYEELYWEPANQEKELMVQLMTKLGLSVISAESVELKSILGTGEFGSVHRGILKSKCDNETCGERESTVTEVAVKTMKKGAMEEDRVKFLQEAAIMGQFKHPNILRVLGIVMDDPVMIVEEIMPKGDLLHHLISLRPQDGKDKCEELGAILLSYTRQVALGMTYLSMKSYVHRDLAARNILVSEDCVCKIADFGLSRSLHNGSYYVSQGGRIPVKWTAPEALHYRKYSNASDVWSYGCLLYEIWSLGYKPFHNVTNDQVIQKVASGYRLPPPPGCPRNIYKLMINCWNPKSAMRPKFCDTVVSLQQPDFKLLKWNDSDTTNCQSEKAKIIGAALEEGYCLYEDLQMAYVTDSEMYEEHSIVDSNKQYQ